MVYPVFAWIVLAEFYAVYLGKIAKRAFAPIRSARVTSPVRCSGTNG